MTIITLAQKAETVA